MKSRTPKSVQSRTKRARVIPETQWCLLLLLRDRLQKRGVSPLWRDLKSALQSNSVSWGLKGLLQNGWLESHKIGRRVHFALTPAALRWLRRPDDLRIRSTRHSDWDFNRTRHFVRSLELRSRPNYLRYVRSLPKNRVLTPSPQTRFARSGWQGWEDFLQTPPRTKTQPGTSWTEPTITVIPGLGAPVGTPLWRKVLNEARAKPRILAEKASRPGQKTRKRSRG